MLSPASPAGGLPAIALPAPPRVSMTLAAAATQFEALMIAQMLKESHGDGGGWLGGGDEAGAATEAGLAEEQFAQALAQNGGLGLRSCLLAGLSQRSK